MRSGIVISGARNPDVFSHNGIAFFLELLAQDLL